MNNVVCGDCWRRENLTFAQRLDPAFIRPGFAYLCAEHRACRAELLGRTEFGQTAA
ncbi:hypothetical protein OG874_01030 [Nocardia sp. NBC_00565]|uniref:hypothetical protein n=1 Tax=Nocardia sp. NBC_00565 TaxID=2975993 RepID=UPI002E81F1D6|nr:hypothetical protein [Nocardia sp. NBC_00565]WUC03834.1 hypothetical protein OG874_01030 [Nocardia sp. NBC_00565]